MQLAAQIGLSVAEWRQMTPRELRIWADAYLKQQKRMQHDRKVMTYNLSALIRSMIWKKHAPRYEDVFPENRGPMDDDAMYSTVRALNKLFGGKEE